MSFQTFSLHQLGWQAEYARLLTLADFDAGYPARVMAVHRSGLAVLSSRGAMAVALPHALAESGGVAVGDWVLVEHEADRALRVLDRRSLLSRVAAGGDHRRQPIAANLDALFVVSSCNDDFNPSRLERYLALALDAGVLPVVVLTKADLGEDAADYVAAAEQLMPGLSVLAVNALDEASVSQLGPWLTPGKTVAFVGSSGVGKSTLANHLTGAAMQRTAGIREDDARGRHTTTAREMFPTPGGAWVIDTPGMRELRVAVGEAELGAVFDDIDALATQCRFGDCRHEGDAGCAVEAAVADGALDARRLSNYRKLQRESAHAQRSLREQHEHSRQFNAVVTQAMRVKKEKLGR
ncbi:ribosome small subunit-dependent GTPase A [Dyella telluris]|uniref:Small ribosomal subunit biogenesis GTPase RsgA n=1 Tax=Dyella telluris TaxID=2763498 RepID=A0A7G8Q7W1_9GAMM|nr:ribosome small subunit-dependent GTPase A [Dyella telluris]QNK02869.1 ribosome small subunit-dependent GTPase A [Dyella telluris]